MSSSPLQSLMAETCCVCTRILAASIIGSSEEDDWGLEGNQKYPAQVGTDLNSFIDNLTTSPQPTQEEIRQVMKHGSVTITPKAVD